MPVAYVTLQQFCAFHQCDAVIVQSFIDHGILTAHRQAEVVSIPELEVRRAERALRLYTELGVNEAGIDIILNLLERLEGVR